ncbi:histidine kinase N-terminal 7TM domain-containing protein [Haloarchaeobius sp. HME9146]|uniref:sensor histidine kinase n=1 Tax=Haloarchaeobius sp. HME9146 TaxID=2978732 RepID=UPI0021C0EC29|nr:histidine kinase N-terminal 7TM domain-containing protein [Haloarchaeobius sp. HME9146]MCT9097282.1 ATP-binding protein [Haloarchaeobius sp. HME9146]
MNVWAATPLGPLSTLPPVVRFSLQAVFSVGIPISLVVAAIAWRNRPAAGSRPLTVFMLSMALWFATVLGSSLVPGTGLSLLLSKLLYVAVVTIIPAWYALVLEYTGKGNRLTRPRIGLFALVGAVAVALVFAYPAVEVFWTDVTPAAALPPGETASISGHRFSHGPGFWALFAYGTALLVAGTYHLLRYLYYAQDVYRRQGQALVIAVAAPWTANAFYITDLTAFDPTPFGLFASGLAFAWAMFQFRFLDLSPVAREAVVENMRDGVFVLDEDDRLVDINGAARDMLDLRGQSVLGDRLDSVLDDSYQPVAAVAVSASEDSRTTVGVENEYDTRYFDVQAAPQRDGRGRDVGRLYLLHDITDRKAREEELERQNEQLERFASLVSHDLRNPLNVAEGYVELARETGNVAHLDEVTVSHDRMRDIIDDVLALARAGQTVDATEPVSLASLAWDAWETVDTGSGTLVVDGDCSFLADQRQLRRALENLFRNSVEHTTPGVQVRIGPLPGDEQGFYVEDDGPGIPEAEREQVLEDGYSTNEEGTGLGLSIVRSIVEGHGWSLVVTDGRDGGARFEVTGTAAAHGRVAPEVDDD